MMVEFSEPSGVNGYILTPLSRKFLLFVTLKSTAVPGDLLEVIVCDSVCLCRFQAPNQNWLEKCSM